MQTGDCAGFGDQPKAAARRLLSRALWVGGLAVAGSLLGAVSASASEAERAEEPSNGLLSTLTSTVEPVTGLAGSLAEETDKVLTEDLALTDDVLGEDAVLGDVEAAGLVDQPADEQAETAGSGDAQQQDSDTPELAAERDAAIEAPTDRSMRREPVEDARERDADAGGSATDAVAERGLASLIGAVDRALTTSGVVPEIAEVANVDGAAAAADELTSGATSLLGRVASEEPSAHSAFNAPAITEPLAAVTGLVTLLDRPLADGTPTLQPLERLRGAFDPVVGAAVPPPANTGALAGQARQETTVPTPSAPSVLDHTSDTSADSAPRSSFDETGAARTAGHDGETAVIHSSPDAGTDGQDPFRGPRGGLRPSLLVTPVAGLSALHVGAPGAATSADQAGPSSHALLPEEAVLRARLFSAAAYARNVEAKPQREANDPPVSPD